MCLNACALLEFPPRRDTVNVNWNGQLYDCDFNQQMDIPMAGIAGAASGAPGHSVFDLNSLDELTGRAVRVDNHCYGCMAGSGSSCQGATN